MSFTTRAPKICANCHREIGEKEVIDDNISYFCSEACKENAYDVLGDE
jgi:hypothetical protein